MAKEATQTVQIGVAADGRLPLPWLGETLAASAALAGAHALLIHGPAGAGHLEFSLLLAQATLCEAPGAARSGQPCGRCASCHLVATRVHPDLLLVLPDALRVQLGWVDDEDSKLTKADAKPSRDIRVEQVRQAIAWSQQTSGRGRGKVMVLHPADALNGPAANALLKTLEEPPGAMRLLLTSADPERLLPTVRSRCQRLPLGLPPPAQAEAWLREQGLAEPAALLALAGGSPLEALAWAREGMGPALLAELPRRVAAGDASPLAGRGIPRVVELLLKLAHDAQVLAAGGAPRFFAAQHLPAGADPAALRVWQQALLRAARHDEHPWNAGLLIESLVTQATAVWPRPAAGVPLRGGASLNSRA
ncbi:MAG: DNA polymerase III subunit delta' [Burkholderiales bacterium RIFCSPHIGHO2_12_FULL_69_20]|nr:MAG: DNA polymerase III subunit delta' [Burkholderiales bacterium RIFCSPHIGHO2_12_FULL_69_20]